MTYKYFVEPFFKKSKYSFSDSPRIHFKDKYKIIEREDKTIKNQILGTSR